MFDTIIGMEYSILLFFLFFIPSSLLTWMLCRSLSLYDIWACVGLDSRMCVLDLPFSYTFRSRPAFCISST